MNSSIKDIKRAQQIRLRRFGMSVATYALAILATFLITLLGIGTLSSAQWTILFGICLFGIGLFFSLYYTKINLRFKEASLTREQIIYPFLYAILAMHWLPEARPIILLFFLPPFSFGMLILSRQQYLVVVTWVLGLYAALLGYEFFLYNEKFMFQYQLFLFVIYAILLLWFAIFGGFISNLRQRLKSKTNDMKKINDEINIEIEERKKLEKDLKEMANTDFLTGVMNRRNFFDKARDEISRHQRFNHPLTILMLDIDHFKKVNDNYGHPAGDFIIQSVANILKKEVRKNDLICRFGGEEFALLLVETDNRYAVETANRLLNMINKETYIFDNHNITITVSIGMTTTMVDDTNNSIQTLISRSDKALYRAKELGRNRIEIDSPTK